jgi:predicted RNase H-like HicB family nuclease
MTSSYLVIYERGEGTVSAYAPELQLGAVISTGRDYEEARRMIAEAIALYSMNPVTKNKCHPERH